MAMPDHFQLQRDGFGRLVLTTADGVRHEGVLPVRAFPLAAPDEGISLVNAEGREALWIDRLAELPVAARLLIDEDLAQRDFSPKIQRIRAVSTFSTPSQWDVDTDRGATRFELKGEEDIRRVGTDGMLLIASSHGIFFTVPDWRALDRGSRRLLERFL